jgi:hypothetical protein
MTTSPTDEPDDAAPVIDAPEDDASPTDPPEDDASRTADRSHDLPDTPVADARVAATPPTSPARALPSAPVLPRSADDTDAGWGERPHDDDERLRRDVPPHWG